MSSHSLQFLGHVSPLFNGKYVPASSEFSGWVMIHKHFFLTLTLHRSRKGYAAQNSEMFSLRKGIHCIMTKPAKNQLPSTAIEKSVRTCRRVQVPLHDAQTALTQSTSKAYMSLEPGDCRSTCIIKIRKHAWRQFNSGVTKAPIFGLSVT